MPYERPDMEQILRLRAKTEGLEVDDDALAALGAVGVKATLRYVKLSSGNYQYS